MRAGIALGSNVGDRLQHLREARQRLQQLELLGAPFLFSRVYETDPVDSPPGAAAFLNAVLEAETEAQPITLLDALQELEQQLGRPSRRPRNAPRTIDLDLLYMGQLTLNNREIMIPHPRLHMREFVLRPLADVAPTLLLPGQRENVRTLLEKATCSGACMTFREQW